MTATAPDFAPLPPLLRPHAEHAWQTFADAADAAQIKAALSRAELPRVWAGSDFVAMQCAQHAELLPGLIESGELDAPPDPQSLAQAAQQDFADIADETQLHQKLRQFRRRHMVRMAWRDLAGAADLTETMRGVSALAEICIQTALRFHFDWLRQRFGEPQDKQGRAAGFVVLALGKLGGNELNYSSDVDLMFAYDRAGETRAEGGGKTLSNQEFFIKLGRKIIDALDNVTADGFVFRTDLRLRPNGDSGPLVLSFAALEYYYQTHGRDWERYALLKARAVAGEPEAGAALLDMLRPFVYRRYLDFGAYQSLREMKRLIEQQQRHASHDDIKRGPGGIREAEFFVQSLQLIRGGRDPSLRMHSFADALCALARAGELSDEKKRGIEDAYVFLRNSEHRLQMAHDRQTQALPEREDEQMRLAWNMHFDSWDAYKTALDEKRRIVRDMFVSAIGDTAPGDDDSTAHKTFHDIWCGALPEEAAVRALAEAGFTAAEDTPSQINKLLVGLRGGRLYHAFSTLERDRLDRLMPLALAQIARHSHAERAVRAFIGVIEAIGRRSTYMSLLIENPAALQRLLHLCAVNETLSRRIGLHPVVLDELLHPQVDIRAQSAADIAHELQQRLAQDADDEEQYLDAMRDFFHARVLRIAAADVDRAAAAEDVMRALSQLAEAVLGEVFRHALAHTAAKLGARKERGGVIAYGKLAGAELGYDSDLDIVVCYLADDAADLTAAEYFYSRAGQRLIHLLTAHTPAGALYELDMRLRPSGRSGALVTSLRGFLDYQLKRAWTWEHQALVLARAVVGGGEFAEAFEAVRAEILTQPREREKLRTDVCDMRARMIEANAKSTADAFDLKLDAGGIVDIEFLTQYLILLNAHARPELLAPRSTSAQLAALAEQRLLPAGHADALTDAYRDYMRRVLYLKLMHKPVLIGSDEMQRQRRAVRAAWDATLA